MALYSVFEEIKPRTLSISVVYKLSIRVFLFVNEFITKMKKTTLRSFDLNLYIYLTAQSNRPISIF